MSCTFLFYTFKSVFMHNGPAVLIVRYGIITLFNALLFGAGHNSDNWTLQYILNDVKNSYSKSSL